MRQWLSSNAILVYKLLTLFKNINSDDQLKWAPQARGPPYFAQAAQSIATSLRGSVVEAPCLVWGEDPSADDFLDVLYTIFVRFYAF